MCSGKMLKYIEEHQLAKAVNYSAPDVEARKRGEQDGLDTRVVHALNVEY